MSAKISFWLPSNNNNNTLSPKTAHFVNSRSTIENNFWYAKCKFQTPGWMKGYIYWFFEVKTMFVGTRLLRSLKTRSVKNIDKKAAYYILMNIRDYFMCWY